MNIDKARLIQAVKILDLVPARPGIPSSEFIRFAEYTSGSGGHGILMSLSSDAYGNMFVPCDMDETFAKPFYIDRKALLPFLFMNEHNNRRVKGRVHKDTISITKEKVEGSSVLTFRIGRRKISLTAVPKVSGYSDPPDIEGRKVDLSTKQKHMINCALGFASTDQGLPQLMAVAISDNGFILSSNDRTIFVGKTKKTEKHDGFLLPLFALSLLSHAEVRYLRINKEGVVIHFKNGTIMQALPAQALKSFPHKRIMAVGAKDIQEVFNVNAGKLCSRLWTFSGFMSASKEKLVQLVGTTDGKLTIRGTVSHAKVSDFLYVSDLRHDFEMAIPLEMVMPFLEFLKQDDQDLSFRFSDKTNTPYYLVSKYATLVLARKSN